MTREEVKAEIRSRLDERGSVVVAIEGMCGAGKSTFAEELAREFDARLFRADDYFLRPEQRTPQRLSEVGGACKAEVRRPLQAVFLQHRHPVGFIFRALYSGNGG